MVGWWDACLDIVTYKILESKSIFPCSLDDLTLEDLYIGLGQGLGLTILNFIVRTKYFHSVL